MCYCELSFVGLSRLMFKSPLVRPGITLQIVKQILEHFEHSVLV